MIVGVGAVLYGTDDLPAAIRFWNDLGLILVELDDAGGYWAAPGGGRIGLAHPAAPGLRRVVFQVDDGLDRYAALPGAAMADGFVKATDPDGLMLEFEPATAADAGLRLAGVGLPDGAARRRFFADLGAAAGVLALGEPGLVLAGAAASARRDNPCGGFVELVPAGAR